MPDISQRERELLAELRDLRRRVAREETKEHSNNISATLTVDQASTTAAIPVLVLDQADLDQPMIEFITTIGVGNAVEAIGAKTLTTTHFIMIELPGGLIRYIPAGTIA